MTNAIQWLWLIVGVLCVIVPPTVLILARPWTRRSGWARSAYWYSAVAVMVFGGALSFTFILVSGGELRRSRAAWLNDYLEAISAAAGPGAPLLPAFVIASAVVGAALVASLRRRPVHLPAKIDAAMLRRLIGAGEDVETLEAAYPASVHLPEAERALAIALGRADAEARRLARWVPQDYIGSTGDRTRAWEIGPLVGRVLSARTVQDSHVALEELRSLARLLDASL